MRVRKAKIVNTEPIPVKQPDFAFDFVLRPKQVAKAMGISTTTLYRWVAAGIFPKPQRLGVSMSFNGLRTKSHAHSDRKVVNSRVNYFSDISRGCSRPGPHHKTSGNPTLCGKGVRWWGRVFVAAIARRLAVVA